MISDVLSYSSTEHQTSFTQPLLNWYFVFGRSHLPWQSPYDPYRVWISEIMLQQTQVKTVIPYFMRFIETFPTVHALAQASSDQVLALWSGLGYYTRARNLHAAAKLIVTQHQGIFPNHYPDILALPGIGESTASAIASLAFQQAYPILDGNVKRVLSRYFGMQQILKHHAEPCLSLENPRAYSQAIMDLGSLICTPKNPQCSTCPVQKTCVAHQTNTIEHYPIKKPKKIRPIQEEYHLMIISKQNTIYLEKRPAKGIWGGLWSFPNSLKESPITDLQKKYVPTSSEACSIFFEISHAFTHFQLILEAYCLIIDDQNHCLMQNNGRWFHPEELSQIGLSKPTTILVERWIAKDKL